MSRLPAARRDLGVTHMTRAALAAALLAVGALAGCAPAIDPGTLAPTMTVEDRADGSVAVQNGIPVPSFEWQPRPRIELDGAWRVDRELFDSDLSLTDRERALDLIVAQAGGREQPGFDDSAWEALSVPGTLNTPPKAPETGAWYRRSFAVPDSWTGLAVTLKFGAVNYLADVWLNGRWLGYHEGGYTPFAFDATAALLPGERNVLAVRVDNPAWGTRTDIVPWGLADWWNYGGITRSVRLEATPPLHVVRADVVPHLDAADISVLVRHAGGQAVQEAEPSASAGPSPSEEAAGGRGPEDASVSMEILPAQVTAENLTDQDVRRLVPGDAEPIASAEVQLGEVTPGATAFARASISFGGPDRWSPDLPALYVLHVTVTGAEGVSDELWTTFGLRRLSVDPETPRLLLNGEAVMFRGVGLHDEVIEAAPVEEEMTARRPSEPEELLPQLERARSIGANLLRAGHTPASPLLLMLADRLGFAVWEEIPLYHFTPLTFGIAMERGIPQQMLQEMALRDMNRASVLFHGLANESTGEDERTDALRELHEVDRAIDGTRLTGQAAYGSIPTDPTHAPLDVAGFTFYYGVFYGRDPAADTERALRVANATNPGKPILALEFGRWADGPDGEEAQRRIFAETYPVFARRSGARGGFVGAATWWTLDDFMTAVPGIVVEQFGLFDASGTPRAAAAVVAESFDTAAGRGPELAIESDARVAQVEVSHSGGAWRLVLYVGYALAVSIGALGAIVGLLLLTGGRAVGRRATAATR